MGTTEAIKIHLLYSRKRRKKFKKERKNKFLKNPKRYHNIEKISF